MRITLIKYNIKRILINNRITKRFIYILTTLILLFNYSTLALSESSYPTSIVVDREGSFYVASMSLCGSTDGLFRCADIVKYDKDGNQLWVRTIDKFYHVSDPTILLDENDELLAMDQREFGFKKYDGEGNVVNEASYSNDSDDRAAYKMTIDSAGDIIVTGVEVSCNESSIDCKREILTVKYSQDGDPKWVRRKYFLGYDDDQDITVLLTDEQNNLYIVGNLRGIYGNMVVILSYDSKGELRWKDVHNDYQIELNSGDLRNINSIYFAGFSSSADCILLEYNEYRNLDWSKYYMAEESNELHCGGDNEVLIDRKGRLNVMGYFQDGVLLVNFLLSNEIQWASYNRCNCHGPFVHIGDNNLLYISALDQEGTDFVTMKYVSDGRPLWIARYNSGNHTISEPQKITTDNGDNVLVIMSLCYESSLKCYSLILKYDSIGRGLWATRYLHEEGSVFIQVPTDGQPCPEGDCWIDYPDPDDDLLGGHSSCGN